MITPNYDLDIDSTLGGDNASDYVISSQKAIKSYVDNTSVTPSNMVTTDTAQNITGAKTFVGQKMIGFKQSGSSDKLGFTLYNNSGTEKGYLEYNPSNTVDSVPLMTLGNYATAAAGLTHVGFRKYSSISGASGAYNLLAPLISDAKTPFNLTTTYTNFYLPLGFSNGTTTVTTAKTGVVDLSSLGYALSSSLATVATSGSYADLSNKPTIPTVNNATLTITQGGVSKGTFTANASSDVTIALDAGGSGGSSSLAGLSDVSLTSPSSNQVLAYDGSEWVNNSLKTINLQNVVGSGNIVVQAPLTAGEGITIEGGISNWNTATQYSNISSIDENCNITYGGGIYLVTDRYGYTSTSTDGETWAVASQNSNLGQEEWWAVCYGNGKFVAICDTGYVSTSTDGVTWSSLVDISVPHSNIAYGNNLYVALTANGYVSTSSDAETWTTQTYNSDLGNQDWSKPIFNGSQFVTVSPNGYVAFSDDGENWSVSETDLANTFTWYAFGYNGIYYVTVGINGYLSYSPDGVNWSEPAFITNLGQRGWVDVTYDGARLITIGNFGYLADSETSQIISANVTVPVFTGATQLADGTSGLVKQPLAGEQLNVLTGDGDWSALKTINNTDLFAWPNDTNLSLADTTLSNVSSIDSNSAVQTALDSKVEYAFVIVDYTS